MFYRYSKDGRRKAIDLNGIYDGAVFICGGHPSLRDEDLSLFQRHGITTMAINNTGTLFKPTLWVCGDKPKCYSDSIILDPSVLKFARLLYQDEDTSAGKWKYIPATLFFGLTEDYKPHQLLHDRTQLVWWKNTFMIAIQLCYRLGFRKVYLCGTGFKIDKEQQYSYDTRLTDKQVSSNQRCYNNVLDQFTKCYAHFKEYGYEVLSCTPKSPINDVVPFIPLTDAILGVMHPQHNTVDTLHSSELNPPK